MLSLPTGILILHIIALFDSFLPYFLYPSSRFYIAYTFYCWWDVKYTMLGAELYNNLRRLNGWWVRTKDCAGEDRQGRESVIKRDLNSLNSYLVLRQKHEVKRDPKHKLLVSYNECTKLQLH